LSLDNFNGVEMWDKKLFTISCQYTDINNNLEIFSGKNSFCFVNKSLSFFNNIFQIF
jgi:hypothetical protein